MHATLCSEWIANEAMNCKSASEYESWCMEEVEIWKALLSEMHLTGGGREVPIAENRRSFHFADA